MRNFIYRLFGYRLYTTWFGKGRSFVRLETVGTDDAFGAENEHVQLINQFENDLWVRLDRDPML